MMKRQKKYSCSAEEERMVTFEKKTCLLKTTSKRIKYIVRMGTTLEMLKNFPTKITKRTFVQNCRTKRQKC